MYEKVEKRKYLVEYLHRGSCNRTGVIVWDGTVHASWVKCGMSVAVQNKVNHNVYIILSGGIILC